MLGGLLVGVTISGVCLAIFQANAGGAWDNSKKQVKEGGTRKYGDAYDEMHKATVTGDTVGDPLKDTSGLNILQADERRGDDRGSRALRLPLRSLDQHPRSS
jgi:K(+)-stimulated pyrophosphate-energized sodium pump